MKYPDTRVTDVADLYGHTRIADPYRWLEDLDSPEVAEWVAAQNAVTFAHLESLPLRRHFTERLTELWDYPRTGLPVIEGGRLFYSKNTGLQRQAPVYMRTGMFDPPAVVLDPNELSPDGSVSLAQYMPSPDAKLLAYAVAQGGADWQTVRVRSVATGQDLADSVSWVRFSDISWTHDSLGFFYSRYPEPPKNKVLEAELSGQAIYYHRLGTPQSADQLIYQRVDHPSWIVNATVSDDGRWVFIRTYRGADNNNQLHFIDLEYAAAPNVGARIVPIVETLDAEFAPIGNYHSRLYLRSDKDAPRRRIIAIDLENPDPAAWKIVVPEQPHAIEQAALIGGRIITHCLVDVQSRLQVFALDGGKQGEIALPGIGAVSGIYGKADEYDVWFQFSSPLTPATVYRHDLEAQRSVPFEAAEPPFEAAHFETRAMFATSKDGTRVPFFLTCRKGLALDGRNPTMLYGYGGFSISVLPAYRADVPAWLEMGGVFVSVNMRGGAEYGERWHKDGALDKKQNVFDDFIAVAESLIANNYTSPDCLGMMGGSNGGLLVGAVMEQRPDLFSVAMPAVGVMDMLRYDRFTGGRLWATEYGSSSDPRHFAFLIKYSPLHNVKPGTCYPATLVTTADHDDRVVPSHSFKFTAALQAAQGCERPVLIRVETRGSHAYRPTDRLIAERADQWAFAAAHLRPRTAP
ncbi:MAG TPA: prolyl oligopeptidase family serine peptidase [Vicinamibacterales bacterium]|nr:prolyl oligopeptidase family serine peptidase [Vicinamibacterales bacterium]